MIWYSSLDVPWGQPAASSSAQHHCCWCLSLTPQMNLHRHFPRTCNPPLAYCCSSSHWKWFCHACLENNCNFLFCLYITAEVCGFTGTIKIINPKCLPSYKLSFSKLVSVLINVSRVDTISESKLLRKECMSKKLHIPVTVFSAPLI